MSDAVHLVAVLGRGVLDTDEPVVTAHDLGLTRGDGCFESVRVVTGTTGQARAGGLDGHLDRLAGSARALDIAGPSPDDWRDLVEQALAAWSTPGESVLRLLLTRSWPPGCLRYAGF